MDKNLITNQFMTKRVMITRYSNKEPLYGSIIGFEPLPLGKMKRWLFVNNIDIIEYVSKKNTALIVRIDDSDIADIDFQIK